MRFSYSKIVAQSLCRLLDYLKLNGNPVIMENAIRIILLAVSKTNTNPIHSVFAKCDQY